MVAEIRETEEYTGAGYLGEPADFLEKKLKIEVHARDSGYFDIRTFSGEKVHASAKYSKLRLIKHASTTLIERRSVSSVRTNLTVSTG